MLSKSDGCQLPGIEGVSSIPHILMYCSVYVSVDLATAGPGQKCVFSPYYNDNETTLDRA